ncbi:MAG: 30S ribosome-binding factor RbfA [Chloroflexota bacterium]
MLHRSERAASFIKEELIELLRGAVRDPRVRALTVTDVDLTRDRRIARVYVACYSGEDDLREGLAGLESAKGFLRREISQLLHWPFAPWLEFRVDRSWDYGNRIDAILGVIAEETDATEDAQDAAGDEDDDELE